RPCQSSLMQKTCFKIRSECCDCFAPQSASSLATPCFHGHPACTTLTASGQNIGTRTSQDQHRLSRTSREKDSSPIVCAKFTSNAANVMTGCMNTDCIDRGLRGYHGFPQY